MQALLLRLAQTFIRKILGCNMIHGDMSNPIPIKLTEPLLRVMKLYSEKAPLLDFSAELEWFLNHGEVWNSSSMFYMGHTVKRGEFKKWENHITPDAWYIRAAACAESNLSPIKIIFKHLPYPLKWICWGRRMKPQMKFYKFERVKKLTELASSGLIMKGLSYG